MASESCAYITILNGYVQLSIFFFFLNLFLQLIVGEKHTSLDIGNLKFILKRKSSNGGDSTYKITCDELYDLFADLDYTKKIVLYSSGWTTNLADSKGDVGAGQPIIDELVERNDVNVVVIYLYLVN